MEDTQLQENEAQGGAGDVTLFGLLEQNRETETAVPAEPAERTEFQRALRNLLPDERPAYLTERDYSVLVAHVRDDRRYRDIGAEFQVSAERVRQVLEDATEAVLTGGQSVMQDAVPVALQYAWKCPYCQELAHGQQLYGVNLAPDVFSEIICANCDRPSRTVSLPKRIGIFGGTAAE